MSYDDEGRMQNVFNINKNPRLNKFRKCRSSKLTENVWDYLEVRKGD